MKYKYIYQKFLLNNILYQNTPIRFENLNKRELGKIQDLGIERNLFDYGNPLFIRKISVEDLDDTIDSESDWQNFLQRLSGVDKLVIVIHELYNDNPILHDYRMNTLKAYAASLSLSGIVYTLVYVPHELR